MKELSQVWDQLTDISQANLLERLGGKRNANVVAALLKNFDTAEEVVKTSADSAGSALNENEKYLDSVNGKLQQLSSSFEEMSAAFLSSNLMKGLIDGGNSAIQVFTKLIDTIGSIPTALAAFTLARSWINVAKGKQTGILDVLQTPAGTAKKDSVMLFGHTIGEYNKAFKQLKSDATSTNPVLSKMQSVFGSIGAGGKGFFAVKSGITSTIDAYNQMAKESRGLKGKYSTFQSTLGGNDELTQKSKKAYDDALSAQKSFIENTKKNNKYLGSEFERAFNSGSTASLTGYKNALDSAGKSMVAFQIKAKAAAVGVKALSVAGSVLTAALSGIAIGAVISGITALVTHTERARQAAADAAQEYSQSVDSISEYKSEVASINQELSSGTLSSDEAYSKRQRLLQIQGELVSQYGAEASSLNLVSSSAEQAAAAFDKLAASQGEAYLNENKDKISEARNRMEQNFHKETALAWRDNGVKGDLPPEMIAALKKSIEGIDGFSFKDTGNGELTLTIDANTNAANKGLDQMQQKLKELGYDMSHVFSESFGNSGSLEDIVFGAWKDDLSKTISDYGEIYDEAIKSKIDTTESYSSLKKSIESVSAAYDEALTKGYDSDTERAKAMSEQLQAVDRLQAALDGMEFDSKDNGVKEYFQGVIDDIRNTVSKEKLKVDIEFDGKPDVQTSDYLSTTLQQKLLTSTQVADIRSAVQEYKKLEVQGYKITDGIYGNINANNNKTIEWTKENLATYEQAYKSWGKTAKDLEGSFSSVFGQTGTFGDGIEVAFSPMLQTDSGAVMLDKNTVTKYINELFKASSSDGEWSASEMMKLDVQGLEIDGQKISHILAGVGADAKAAGEEMKNAAPDGLFKKSEAQLKEMASQLGVSMKDLLNGVGVDVKDLTSDSFSDVKKQLDAFRDDLGNVSLKDILDTRSAVENELQKNVNYEGANAQEKAYLKLSAAAKDYGVSVDTLLSTLASYNYIQEDTNQLAYQGLAKFTELSNGVTAVETEQSKLNEALQQQAANGTISLETYNGLIEQSAAFADCLEYENGNMVINAEKAYDLVEAKARTRAEELKLQAQMDNNRYKLNAEEIERLSSASGELTDANKARIAALKEENAQIEANTAKYRIQYAELMSLVGAYAEWKNAQQTANPGTMYNEMYTALDQIKTGLKYGEVGSDDFKTSVEMLVPVKFQTDGEPTTKYLARLKRYIKEDEHDASGALNFVKDAAGKGLMQYDKHGNANIVEGVGLQDFIDKLEVTPTLAKAMFDKLELYGAEFKWTDDDWDKVFNTEALNNKISKSKDELDELKQKKEEVAKTPTESDDSGKSSEQKSTEVQKVDKEIWETQHQIIEMEVEASDKTDVGKLIEQYRLKFAEKQHALEIDPTIDTSKYDSELESMKTKLNGLSDETKQAFDIDPSLFQYGVASMTDTVNDLAAAYEALKTAQSSGNGPGTAEYDTAYQKVQELVSVIKNVPDIESKLNIDTDIDTLTQQILDGKISPEDIAIAITADGSEARDELGKIEAGPYSADVEVKPIVNQDINMGTA